MLQGPFVFFLSFFFLSKTDGLLSRGFVSLEAILEEICAAVVFGLFPSELVLMLAHTATYHPH